MTTTPTITDRVYRFLSLVRSDGAEKQPISSKVMESIDDGSTGREQSVLDELLAALAERRFHHWYKERQYRKNIENGTPHYNESGFVPGPERHSPSKLPPVPPKNHVSTV